MIKMQRYSSACTDINSKTRKLPKLFSLQEKYCMFNTNDRVLDLGCGRSTSHIRNYLRKWGVGYRGYDPYNQPDEVNKKSLELAPYTVVTISNVLNVIAEIEVRQALVKQAWDLTEDNGVIYITVYEGNKSGILKVNEDSNSCQLNKKWKFYLDEVTEVLPEADIVFKHGVIMIKKVKPCV